MTNIKEARKQAGLTQQKMSELLGIPKRTIQDWERGVRTPPAYVERMAVEKLRKIGEEKMNVHGLKEINSYLNALITTNALVWRSEVIAGLESLGVEDDEMLHRKYEKDDTIYFNQLCTDDDGKDVQAIYTVYYETVEACKFEDEEDNAQIVLLKYDTRLT